MPTRFSSRLIIVWSLLAGLLSLAFGALPAEAAASQSVSTTGTVKVGDTVTASIYVNTGGQAANAFEGTLSYPSSLLDGVRGSYSGSICSLPVETPDPSGGSASYSCGSPSGFNGTGLVATVVFTATSAGSGTFGLSDCTVLANDGHGTDITGGCSGTSITVTAAPTPTPTPAPTATPTPTQAPAATTKATTTKASAAPIQSPKAAESPKATTAPTPTPTPPPAQALPSPTPTPQAAAVAASAAPGTSPTPSAAPDQKRSIGSAFTDLFSSIKTFKISGKDTSGLIALLLTMIPFLAIMFGIVYFLYRLYVLERRRRRTMDRLFEMELGELAALEAKMDLLAEKGSKGREEYREEFHQAKEKILRQLRPDYNKPIVDKKEAATPAA